MGVLEGTGIEFVLLRLGGMISREGVEDVGWCFGLDAFFRVAPLSCLSFSFPGHFNFGI